MAKAPAAKKGQKTQDFVVKDGCRIGGFDGKVKKGGDTIALTKEQAEFYIERELVKPQMPDFDEDEDNTEGDDTQNQKGKDVDKTEGPDGSDGDGDSDTTPDAQSSSTEGGDAAKSGTKPKRADRI